MTPWVSEKHANRPVRDVLIKHLVNLCRIYSPSGYELGTIEYCLPILKSSGFDVELSPEGNIYATRGTPRSGKYMLLNAHTDTVQRDKDASIITHPDLIQFDPFWNIIWGRGYMVAGDDKCGIGIILALAEATQLPMKVLLTVGEECGCEGVKSVPNSFYKDTVFCFTLDRRGCCDIIETYSGRKMAPKGIIDLIIKIAKESFVNMGVANGSFADTFYISEHVPAVNISIGYYNAHSSYDFIRVNETYDTMMVVRSCIEKQDAFEEEWARTPQNWRPTIFKEYAPAYTYYGEYYGSGFGWGYDQYDKKQQYNQTLAKYNRVWNKKTRQWVTESVAAAKDKDRKEKTEEKSKMPKSPADLIAKDDIEPVPIDPFGNSYGDLIWAEKYHPVWEAMIAYPRVKIEKKWVPEPREAGVSEKPRKAEYIPSAQILETEINRLGEIVDLMSKQDPYIWIYGRAQFTIRMGIPVNDLGISLGWIEYKGVDGEIAYRPILKDATSVYEFAKILDDYPDSDILYKVASLAADVSFRIELEKEDDSSNKFYKRSLPLHQYNQLLDAVAVIDSETMPFKVDAVDGAVYEAGFSKIKMGGWNEIGQVSVFVVSPSSPSRDGWVIAPRVLKETVTMYGNLETIGYLRNLFYGRGWEKFDVLLEEVVKNSIEWFSKNAELTGPTVQLVRSSAESGMTGSMIEAFSEEIFSHLTMSSDPAARKLGIPWKMRDQMRSEVLDESQSDEFREIIEKIGSFEAYSTHTTVEPNRTNFEYRAELQQRDIKERASLGTLHSSLRIGSGGETAYNDIGSARTNITSYNNNVGAVLTLYHGIGIILNDYTMPDKETVERLETTLFDLELLMDDILFQWESGIGALEETAEKEAAEEEADEEDAGESWVPHTGYIREREESTYTPDTIKDTPTDDRPYEFVMPFFVSDPKASISVSPIDLVSFVRKHGNVQLTSEEISLLTAGISNYIYMLKNFYRAFDFESGDEISIVDYGIHPDAEVIVRIGVLDPETREYFSGWNVSRDIRGVATMYFMASRFKYDSDKIYQLVRYFNTIAYHVMQRVLTGTVITWNGKDFVLVNEEGEGVKKEEPKKRKEKKVIWKKGKSEKTIPAADLGEMGELLDAASGMVEADIRKISESHSAHYKTLSFGARKRMEVIGKPHTFIIKYEIFTDFLKVELNLHLVDGKPEFYDTIWRTFDSGPDQLVSGISSTPISAIDTHLREVFNLPAMTALSPYDREMKRETKRETKRKTDRAKKKEKKEYSFDREAYQRPEEERKHRRGSSSEYDQSPP